MPVEIVAQIAVGLGLLGGAVWIYYFDEVSDATEQRDRRAQQNSDGGDGVPTGDVSDSSCDSGSDGGGDGGD